MIKRAICKVTVEDCEIVQKAVADGKVVCRDIIKFRRPKLSIAKRGVIEQG